MFMQRMYVMQNRQNYNEQTMKRVENWNRSVNYVINPINHQESTLQSMLSLQNEACFIPVIVSDNMSRIMKQLALRVKLDCIVKDQARTHCYCKGYYDGSEMIPCKECGELFHFKCLYGILFNLLVLEV